MIGVVTTIEIASRRTTTTRKLPIDLRIIHEHTKDLRNTLGLKISTRDLTIALRIITQDHTIKTIQNLTTKDRITETIIIDLGIIRLIIDIIRTAIGLQAKVLNRVCQMRIVPWMVFTVRALPKIAGNITQTINIETKDRDT